MNGQGYTIRIAIAGKRKHSNLDKIRTDGRLKSILDILSDLCKDVSEYSSLKVQFLTGLAEGADQIVTQKIAAYHLPVLNGIRSGPYLDAILPFSKECYRDHPVNDIPDKILFNSLWDKCDSVICVNDKATSERLCNGSLEFMKQMADRAYEAQALLMLRRSDVLLAFMDPDPKVEILPGGTLHSIARARAYHIPVILVSLADDRMYVIDDETDPFYTANLVVKNYSKNAVDTVRVLSVFTNVINGQKTLNSPKKDDLNFERLLRESVDEHTPSQYFLGKRRFRIWNWVNKELRIKAGKELRAEKNVANHTALHKIKFGVVANAHWFIVNPLNRLRKRIFGGDEESIQATAPQSELEINQKKIDDWNTFYSYQYRGGYILNIALAVIAVFFAVTALFVILKYWQTHMVGPFWFSVLLCIIALSKLSAIIAILRNTQLAQKFNWNERSVQTRYLAERLRQSIFLSENYILNGIKPSLGKHLSQEAKSSPPEAAYRKIEGNLSFVYDEKNPKEPHYLQPFDGLERFNKNLVEDQVNFHRKSSMKMKALEEFLEYWGKMLNLITIILVVADLIVLFFSVFLSGECMEECLPIIDFMHHDVAPVFICITALLPAIVAGLNAVRFQSEAKKHKERYATMEELLSKRSEKIKEAITNAKKSAMGSEILEFFPLIAEVEQIMLDEVSDWSIMYRKEFPET